MRTPKIPIEMDAQALVRTLQSTYAFKVVAIMAPESTPTPTRAPPDIATLANKVRATQKRSKAVSKSWHEFVHAHGLCSFDPSRHKASFLSEFLCSASAASSCSSAGSADIPEAVQAHLDDDPFSSEIGSVCSAGGAHDDVCDSAGGLDQDICSVPLASVVDTRLHLGQCYGYLAFVLLLTPCQNQVRINIIFAWTSPCTGKLKPVVKHMSDFDYITYKLTAPTAEQAKMQFAPVPMVGDTFKLPTCTFIDGAGCRNAADCPYSHLMQADDASIAHVLQTHSLGSWCAD